MLAPSKILSTAPIHTIYAYLVDSHDLTEGRGWFRGSDSEKSLKGRHRGPSAVEPENKLIEIPRKVFGLHSVVSAVEPRLEIWEPPKT